MLPDPAPAKVGAPAPLWTPAEPRGAEEAAAGKANLCGHCVSSASPSAPNRVWTAQPQLQGPLGTVRKTTRRVAGAPDGGWVDLLREKRSLPQSTCCQGPAPPLPPWETGTSDELVREVKSKDGGLRLLNLEGKKMDFHCTCSDPWCARDSISMWRLAELTVFISAGPWEAGRGSVAAT